MKACFKRLSYKINAAAVNTDDNDGFNNNLAVDDTIDDWVAGNNPDNDKTGDEDGFGTKNQLQI